MGRNYTTTTVDMGAEFAYREYRVVHQIPELILLTSNQNSILDLMYRVTHQVVP